MYFLQQVRNEDLIILIPKSHPYNIPLPLTMTELDKKNQSENNQKLLLAFFLLPYKVILDDKLR